MAGSSFAPPVAPSAQTATLTLEATKTGAATSLAAGLIAAARKPISIEDALAIYGDVRHAMFPNPGNGHYEAFKADPTRLTKVRG